MYKVQILTNTRVSVAHLNEALKNISKLTKVDFEYIVRLFVLLKVG